MINEKNADVLDGLSNLADRAGFLEIVEMMIDDGRRRS